MLAADSPFRSDLFRRLWLSQTLAQTSNRIFQIAVVWWMMTELKDQSPALYTAIFLVGCALPSILFVKPIGRLVDRASLNSLMAKVLFLAGIALSIATFFAADLTPLEFLLLGCVLALAHAVFDPALQRALSLLVAADSMPKAVSIVTSTQSAANFGGAFLGAFLLEQLGLGALIVIAAAAYGVSAALVLWLPLKASAVDGLLPSEAAPTGESEFSLKNEYPLLSRILIGFGMVNFFATPILVILPLYVKQVLHGTAMDLSILDAGIWVGMMIGTFFAFQVTGRLSALQTAIICLVTMGIAFAIPGLVANKWVYLANLCIAGFVLGVNNTRFITLFQEAIDEKFKGRFFAILQATVSFTVPISFLAFGFIGDHISPQPLCLIQGVGVGILAGYFVLLERSKLAIGRAQ